MNILISHIHETEKRGKSYGTMNMASGCKITGTSQNITLRLGCWNSRWEKGKIKREKKRTGLGPFIKRVNIKRPPHDRLELA